MNFHSKFYLTQYISKYYFNINQYLKIYNVVFYAFFFEDLGRLVKTWESSKYFTLRAYLIQTRLISSALRPREGLFSTELDARAGAWHPAPKRRLKFNSHYQLWRHGTKRTFKRWLGLCPHGWINGRMGYFESGSSVKPVWLVSCETCLSTCDALRLLGTLPARSYHQMQVTDLGPALQAKQTSFLYKIPSPWYCIISNRIWINWVPQFLHRSLGSPACLPTI